MTARKYPLGKLRKRSLKKHSKFIRTRTNEEYEAMSKDQMEARLKEIHEFPSTTISEEQMKDQLTKIERKRHWLHRHDHSGIGNQGMMLFLAREMYVPAIYLTDQEYKTKYGVSTKVQFKIEAPHDGYVCRH
jgi:hypothetical protein